MRNLAHLENVLVLCTGYCTSFSQNKNHLVLEKVRLWRWTEDSSLLELHKTKADGKCDHLWIEHFPGYKQLIYNRVNLIGTVKQYVRKDGSVDYAIADILSHINPTKVKYDVDNCVYSSEQYQLINDYLDLIDQGYQVLSYDEPTSTAEFKSVLESVRVSLEREIAATMSSVATVSHNGACKGLDPFNLRGVTKKKACGFA